MAHQNDARRMDLGFQVFDRGIKRVDGFRGVVAAGMISVIAVRRAAGGVAVAWAHQSCRRDAGYIVGDRSGKVVVVSHGRIGAVAVQYDEQDTHGAFRRVQSAHDAAAGCRQGDRAAFRQGRGGFGCTRG